MTSTYSRSELEAIRDAHYEQLLLNGDDDTEPTVSSGDCDECGFGRNFPCPPYRLATQLLAHLAADDEVHIVVKREDAVEWLKAEKDWNSHIGYEPADRTGYERVGSALARALEERNSDE
jgi:hypothetical protein